MIGKFNTARLATKVTSVTSHARISFVIAHIGKTKGQQDPNLGGSAQKALISGSEKLSDRVRRIFYAMEKYHVKLFITLLVLQLIGGRVSAQLGTLDYNNQVGTISFGCGQTPNTETIELDYTVTLNYLNGCSCHDFGSWVFNLLDANGNIIDNFSQAVFFSGNITYNMTFTVPNEPDEYTVSIRKTENGWHLDQQLNCTIACSENSEFATSNTVVLDYPSPSLNSTYTGDFDSYDAVNEIYTVCAGSELTVGTDECETKFQPGIQPIDQNGNSLGSTDWGDESFASSDGFDFSTLSYNFQSGNYYRLRLRRWHPLDEEHFDILFQNTTSISATDVEVCEGNDVTMTASGASNLFWTPTTFLSGGNTGSSVTAVNPTSSITYTVQSTNACVNSEQVELTFNPLPVIDLSMNPDLICGSNLPYTFQADVTVGGSAVSGGNWTQYCMSGSVYDPPSYCSSTGDYSGNKSKLFSFTSAAGCHNSESFSFFYGKSPELNLSTTDLTCNGSDDGTASVSINGTGPYSISWYFNDVQNQQMIIVATNVTSISNLEPGDYQVIVTDNYGSSGHQCSEILDFEIFEPSLVSVSVSNLVDAPCSQNSISNQFGSATVSFSGGSGTGFYMSIDAGGYFGPVTSPYSINVTEGSHTVEVKESGCSPISASFSIGSTNGFAFDAGSPIASDAECQGINDGKIEIDVINGTANYTYQWNPGGGNVTQASSSYTIDNLAPSQSNYYVTVSDAAAQGCTLVAGPFIIEESNGNQFVPSISGIVDPTCNGMSDGEMSANPSTSGYSHAWSNGATTSSITGLVNGTYNVTVTNSVGCIETESHTLNGINPEHWQTSSDNSNDLTDQGLSVVADDDDNLYVLGSFVGETTIGGLTVDCAYPSSQAFFLAKYDPCGEVQWVLYPEHDNVNQPNMKPSDLALDGGNLYVSLQVNGAYGGTKFNTAPSVPIGPTVGFTNSQSFLVIKVNPNTGQLSNNMSWGDDHLSTNAIAYTDEINDLEVYSGDVYISGKIGSEARVYKGEFITNAPTTAIALENASTFTGSEFVDLEFANSYAFLVGNAPSEVQFGSSTFIPTLNEEGFIVRTSLTNLGSVSALERAYQGENAARGLTCEPGTDLPYIGGDFGSNFYITKKTAALTSTSWSVTSNISNAVHASVADVEWEDDEGKVFAVGAFQGQTISITGNGSNASTAGGNGLLDDMWISAVHPSTGVADWMMSAQNQSSGLSGIEPAAMTTRGANNYIVGNFGSTMSFYMSQESNLTHPNNTSDAMFAIRFGNAYTPNGPAEFYKGVSSSQEEAEYVLEDIVVYPNPSDGIFTVNMPSIDAQVGFNVYDMQSRLVHQQMENGNLGKITVDLSSLSTGTYILYIESGNVLHQVKLSKF